MNISDVQIYCENCLNKMHPVWFIEEEEKTKQGIRYKTGRKRLNVSHFECDICGHKEAVDDSFAKDWF